MNGNFTEFYRDALRYLGCVDINTELSEEERLVYAFDLSLAALLSDEIYNFGELVCVVESFRLFDCQAGVRLAHREVSRVLRCLHNSPQIAHPVLDTLKATDKEWLLNLVYCFNSGDINGFESLQPQWHTQACYPGASNLSANAS